MVSPGRYFGLPRRLVDERAVADQTEGSRPALAAPALRGRAAALARALQARAAGWLQVGAVLGLVLFAAWWLWRLAPFHRVGMATQDQINFSLQGTGDFWGSVLGHARAQGRVYFLLNKIVDLWLAARPEGWRIHAFNVAVFALSAPCFAVASFRTWRERWLYVWLFASVSWLGFHHLPPAAYPSVNHLPFLLWPIAAWLVRRASQRGSDGGWGLLVTFALIAFLGFVQYEPVTGMSLCVLGWLVYDTPRPRLRRRLAAALATSALAYAALYAAWRVQYPTSYDGAMRGELSPWRVLHVTLAYAIGGLPFSEAYAGSIALRFGDLRAGEAFLRYAAPAWQGPEAGALLLSALGLVGLCSLLRRSTASSEPPAGALPRSVAGALLALLLLLAINGPLGLSSKYQSWVRDWDETYLTSQLALYPLVLLGTLLLAAAYQRPRWRGVPLLFVPLVLAVAALSLPVQVHNRRVSALLRANLARWEGVTALAAYARYIEEPIVVAPDLYYSMGSGEHSWTNYWGRYVQQRFGGWLSFRPSPPEQGSFALVRLHRLEDGGLRAISVQTRGYVALVARSRNAPLAVVADSGAGVALDWANEAEVLGRSGYSSVTLREPAQLLGPHRRIEPVWTWPETSLARSRPGSAP